jgi:hypothetical protein
MTDTGLIIKKPSAPQFFHQLGILVLDGSGSMSDLGKNGIPKAQEVEMGMADMFSRFSGSSVKQNFSFACIKFDTTPTISLQPMRFNDMDHYSENFNPLEGKGGGTHIFDALSEAKKLADNFLVNEEEGTLGYSAIILLASDGLCFEPQKALDVANEIKQNSKITLACAYFAEIGNNNSDSSETKNLLQSIATNPIRYYTTVYDGDTLRKFFEASISQSVGIKKISE